ncbi:hypothetical protein [Vibrio marisflavi]|uniref:Lipoprotein n=1 Tax=Vibrio marisflavi CECT 7928 TaxID=634439 RepID=A0ABM9A8R7_9VIBR|nr:hypothetical protein [Vibrio marisflavi]CAH0542645.1 hypothetical protein VMF7928_04135 [Vibrio marisflavi CECT 7928]
MKASLLCPPLLTLTLLQGCSIVQHNSASTGEHATLANPASIQPQPYTIRGQVVLGQEVRSLTPCGGSQQFWVQLPDAKLKLAQSFEKTPYEPMYTELVGHLAPPDSIGYSAGYAAKFVVDNINYLTSFKYSLCGNSPTPTRAFGSEPNWSISFAPNSANIKIDGQPEHSYKVFASSVSSSKRVYQLEQGQLELTRKACTNEAGGFLSGWVASLTLNNKTYKGCGILGNTDSTLNWVGQYAASSTKTSQFDVKLSLNSDHSAKTVYSYRDGKSDIVEQGFWQQLNDTQVQVLMTKHQQQHLISQRIFTLDGNQLTATSEKVGNVLYPIADGGLVLYRTSSVK